MVASSVAPTDPTGEQGSSPVRSLYILKNGLPVFTRDFVPATAAGGEDNQMLVSGFLTALTSFLKDMKDFGEMKSLVTSSNFRFTFYQAESLLFVTCTDSRMDEIGVEKFLRNVSIKFLQAYSKQLGASNMVNMKHYAGFDAIMHRELLARDLRSGQATKASPVTKMPVPKMLVPADEARQVFHFNDEIHEKVIKYIDGKTDVDSIAKLSGMDPGKVTSFVRYLCKQGIVSF